MSKKALISNWNKVLVLEPTGKLSDVDEGKNEVTKLQFLQFKKAVGNEPNPPKK